MELDIIDQQDRIEAFEREMEAAVAAGQIGDLIQRHYTADARLMANHAPAAVGTAAIANAFQGMIDSGVNKLTLQTETCDASGDAVWNTGNYRLNIATPNGDIEDVGKYVTIFRRQTDGTLKCIVDCFNSDLPLPN